MCKTAARVGSGGAVHEPRSGMASELHNQRRCATGAPIKPLPIRGPHRLLFWVRSPTGVEHW